MCQKTNVFNIISFISIILTNNINVIAENANVHGYFYRSMFSQGSTTQKTTYESNNVPDYENSAFWRTYKAKDSRNIRQQDYEYKFAINNNFTELSYKESLLNYTCVITAVTIIVDYYARKNNYNLDTYQVYDSILWDSYYKGYFGIDSNNHGVSQDNVRYVLFRGLKKYKDYTGIKFNHIEKHETDIYTTVQNLINSEDIALYIFSPTNNPHAMVVCGYLNLELRCRMERKLKQTHL